VLLGHRTYSLAAGATANLAVQLAKGSVALLAKAGSRSVAVMGTVTVTKGKTVKDHLKLLMG
jgi:hypothetical protein